MGAWTDTIIPETTGTVAYQPELKDVVIKTGTNIQVVDYEGDDVADGQPEINILTSKEDYLRIYELDSEDANDDLYIDVTFQLDHNEDYESIKYILVSTSFAHEIDPIVMQTPGNLMKGCLLYTSPSPRDRS